MQRRGRTIESDVGGNGTGLRAGIQGLRLRYLMNKAAVGQDIEKIGFVGAHSGASHRGLVAYVSGWCNRSGVGFNNAWSDGERIYRFGPTG